MKKRIGAAALVFCLAALLLTCENTVLTEDGGTSGFDPDYLAALEEAIIFSEPGLVAGTELVSPGVVVTTITFPPEDGPWEAALVKGAGDAHNRLFTIAHEAVSEGESPSYAELKYSGDTALDWGPYSVRIRIKNEEGVAFRKEFPFEVTLSPPLFKNAPRLYPVAAKTDGSYPTLEMSYNADNPSASNLPDITKSKNKLVIKWDKRATATSYRVWAGTMATTIDITKDPTAAPNVPEPVLLGTYSGDVDSVEMTDFPGDESDNDLPNNTRYWVWVDAANASGTTPRSPVATRKTSFPMQEYFYVNTADIQNTPNVPVLHDGGGYGDYYRFTPTTVKYWFGSAGGYNYLGDVVYHETVDLGPNGENGPFPDAIKDGASCLNFPAGVFVIKYREGRVPPVMGTTNKRYSAVYYWGMGTTKPSDAWHDADRIESDIVNQWNGYAERVTYEEAIDEFTAENVQKFVHIDPEPYYKQFPDYDTTKAPCYEPWPGEGTWTEGIEGGD